MSRWIYDLGTNFGGSLTAAFRAHAMATASCIATDATEFAIQPSPSEDNKRRPCRKGHYFALLADRDYVFFEYNPHETSAAVRAMFRGYEGYVQADAKSVYDVLYRAPEPDSEDDDAAVVVKSDAGPTHEGSSGKPLWQRKPRLRRHSRIGRIFGLDATYRKHPPSKMKTLRQEFLRPHVEDFLAFAEAESPIETRATSSTSLPLGQCVRSAETCRVEPTQQEANNGAPTCPLVDRPFERRSTRPSATARNHRRPVRVGSGTTHALEVRMKFQAHHLAILPLLSMGLACGGTNDEPPTEEESSALTTRRLATAESQVRLGATDQTVVRITYKTESSFPNAGGGTTVVAKKPRFVIERPNATSSVRVSVRQKCTVNIGGVNTTDEGSLDLRKDPSDASGRTFVGDFRDVKYYGTDYRGYGSGCEEELTVQVDGRPLIDPANGTDTFRFSFVERQPNGKKKPIQLGTTSDVVTVAYETKAPTSGGVTSLAQDIKLRLTSGPAYELSTYPSGKKARAVFINGCKDASSGKNLPDVVQQKDLTFVGGAYEATLDNIHLTKMVGPATYECSQELAIVVDGRWIKSASGENFRFRFSEYCSPACGN